MDTTKWCFQPVRQPFGKLNAYGFGLARISHRPELDNKLFPVRYRPLVRLGETSKPTIGVLNLHDGGSSHRSANR
ncbi:MAG: hypothetical protein JOZ62_22835 [Acidobacteriaceae bacterium]|nr:hypothetical protein [Acidobacteriaceae bacterium]